MLDHQTKPPFFIVGCGRSGTTLLQILLDTCPNIAIPPESFLFARFSRIFGAYGDLRHEKNLRRFVEDLLSDARIREWKLRVTVADFCKEVKDFSIRGVLSVLFGFYAQQERKSRWGEKTPYHAFYLSQIKAVFRDAKIIHLVRDGRDVAASYKEIWFGPTSAASAAALWRKYINIFQEFKRTAKPDDYLEIKYEDMVANPQESVDRISRFLNEDSYDVQTSLPESDRRRFYLNISGHHQSLSEPISKNKTGMFKQKLKPREVEMFESVAGRELELYGYQRIYQHPLPVSLIDSVKAFLIDRYFFVSRRIRHPKNFIREISQQIQMRWRYLLRK